MSFVWRVASLIGVWGSLVLHLASASGLGPESVSSSTPLSGSQAQHERTAVTRPDVPLGGERDLQRLLGPR